MFPRTRILFLASLLLLALFVVGCTVSPDNSKAFIELAKRVQALEENQKKSMRTLDTVAYDLEAMEREMQEIKTTLTTVASAPTERSGELADALRRVGLIEQQIKDMSKQVSEQAKAAERKAAASAQAVAPAAKTPTQAAPRKASAKPSNLSAAPRRQPSGFYHQIAPGETIQAIARRYDVPSSSLTRANRLPASAQLIPGQPIFIPKM